MKKFSLLIAFIAILALIFGGLVSCDNNSGTKACPDCGQNPCECCPECGQYPCTCSSANLASASIKGASVHGTHLGTPVEGWGVTAKGKVIMHELAAANTSTSITYTGVNPDAKAKIYVFADAAALATFAAAPGDLPAEYTANAAIDDKNVIVFVVTSKDETTTLTYAIEVELQGDVTLTVADHVNLAETAANVLFYIGEYNYYTSLLLSADLTKSVLDSANPQGLTLVAGGVFAGIKAGNSIFAIEWSGTDADATIVRYGQAGVKLAGNFNDIAAINGAIADAEDAALENDPDATADDKKLLQMIYPDDAYRKLGIAIDTNRAALGAGVLFKDGNWSNDIGLVILYADTENTDTALKGPANGAITFILGTPIDMTGKKLVVTGPEQQWWGGGSLMFLGTAASGEETVDTANNWLNNANNAEGEFPVSAYLGVGGDPSKLIRVVANAFSANITEIKLVDE